MRACRSDEERGEDCTEVQGGRQSTKSVDLKAKDLKRDRKDRDLLLSCGPDLSRRSLVLSFPAKDVSKSLGQQRKARGIFQIRPDDVPDPPLEGSLLPLRGAAGRKRRQRKCQKNSSYSKSVRERRTWCAGPVR